MHGRETGQVEDVAAVDLRLWGKSRGLEVQHPLVLHLLDAVAAAESLWRDDLTPPQRHAITEGLDLGDEAHASRLLACWAGVHDIGKLIPGFQALDGDNWAALAAAGYPSVAPGPPLRHDRAAHLTLAALLSARGYSAVGPPPGWVAHRVAQLLGGHHGRFHQAARGINDAGGHMPRQRSAQACGRPSGQHTWTWF